jgi:hypothetical protein
MSVYSHTRHDTPKLFETVTTIPVEAIFYFDQKGISDK